uniref:Uncharacterized protein n=1 Tax=Meloidogyne hapla TaxID=6305 RepID=A0A1I8BDM3_MELHA
MTEDKSFDSDYELIEKEKLKPVYLNIEELKQTFQQMIGEIKTENAKQNSALKEIIEQKDEKIISLVKQVFKKLIRKNFVSIDSVNERLR